MHDPKFEKEVQQKMEELSFSPPEAVWLNVEKAVRGEKKKRRMLPFWLFFAPTVLLMGTGVIYFVKKSSPAAPAVAAVPSHAITPSQATTEATTTPAAGGEGIAPDGSGSTARTAQPETTAKAAGKKGISETGVNGKGVNEKIVNEKGVSGKVVNERGVSGKVVNERGVSEKVVNDKGVNEKVVNGKVVSGVKGVRDVKDVHGTTRQTAAARMLRTTKMKGAGAKAGGKDGGEPAIQTEIKPKGESEIISVSDSKIKNNEELRSAFISGARPLGRDRSPIRAKPLPSFASPAKAKVELPKPRHPWEAGFVGHIGVSSVNQGLLDKLSVTSMDYRNSYSPVQSNPKTYTSSIQPNLSLAVGVLMQKAVSKDWAFSVGLNFHYYSSGIKTGGIVTAPYAMASPSLNTSGSFVQSAGSINYPYYAPGDQVTYTNRYYFMELPASAIWQVGHSRKLPMYLEGGVSVSYLVSSNSLYYEPKAGVFFKDGSMINKTQVGVFSGLMFGLPIKGISMQAGPQLQYGLSNLINNSGSGNQHMMYGGIKLVFLPGRSKPH